MRSIIFDVATVCLEQVETQPSDHDLTTKKQEDEMESGRKSGEEDLITGDPVVESQSNIIIEDTREEHLLFEQTKEKAWRRDKPANQVEKEEFIAAKKRTEEKEFKMKNIHATSKHNQDKAARKSKAKMKQRTHRNDVPTQEMSAGARKRAKEKVLRERMKERRA